MVMLPSPFLSGIVLLYELGISDVPVHIFLSSATLRMLSQPGILFCGTSFAFAAGTKLFTGAYLASGAEIGHKTESHNYTPGCRGFCLYETTAFWGEIFLVRQFLSVL